MGAALELQRLHAAVTAPLGYPEDLWEGTPVQAACQYQAGTNWCSMLSKTI